ncbi:hypothetical protein LMG28614_04182 [Paraburkholderia ultramafica]|uniref:Uncharacterized protein n=1 Tax=Paraburkholderia ultramafica TaxID=1544867 RepID=A0A6S7BCF8_9BURK|nr:hypothetical protein LMG28614_04182 [Paraburkholderia ultramafica]
MIARIGRPVVKLVPIAAPAGKRLGIAQGGEVPDTIDAHSAEIAGRFAGGSQS